MSKLVKKTLALLAVMVFGAVNANAWVAETDDAMWNVDIADNGGATILQSNGVLGGDVLFPSSVYVGGDEYPVVGIGEGAFYDNDTLTGVTFPATIKKIDAEAFEDCEKLAKVEFLGDASAVDCDYTAFWETPYIESLDFKLVIEDGVLLGFMGKCPETVEIPAGVEVIGESAFDHDYSPSVSNLTSVVIPSSVKEIEIYAFYECESLANLTLNNGLETIGEDAFLGCVSLTSLALPASVKTIDYSAFAGCASLAEVTLNNGLEVIESRAFGDCVKLAAIEIPASVKEIRSSTFSGCASLATLTLNEGLEYIGPNAFRGCGKFRELVVPAGVKTIEEYAFANCDLRTLALGDGLEYIGTGAFYGNKKLKEAKIPASVAVIEAYAFSGCEKLATVALADGIASIAAYAFEYTALEELELPASVRSFNLEAFSRAIAGAVTVKAPMAISTLLEEGTTTLADGVTAVTVEFYGDKPAAIDATFHYNYGSPETLVKKELKVGCCAGKLLPDAPVRAGFHFVGWNSKADGTGEEWLTSDTIVGKSAENYYAIWLDGSNLALKDAAPTADGGFAIDGNKDGYVEFTTPGGAGVLTFDWKTEEIAGPDGWFAYMWLDCDGNYCFVDDKDDNRIEYEIYRKGEWTTVSISIDPANDDNYRSWNNDPTVQHVFRWSADDGLGYVRNIKWEEKPFTIAFDPNEGTGYADPIKDTVYPYAEVTTYTLTNVFYRENHSLVGFGLRYSWTDSDGNVHYEFDKFVDVVTTADKDGKPIHTFTVDPNYVIGTYAYGYDSPTLYAIWELNDTTVTFYNFNGAEVLATYTYPYENEIAFPDNFREGWKATGWEKMTDEENAYKVKGWETDSFTVSFDTKEAGKIDPITFTWDADKKNYGKAVTITTTVDRVGYTLGNFEWEVEGATIVAGKYETYRDYDFVFCRPIEAEDGTAKYEFTIDPNAFTYKRDVTLTAVWFKNVQVELVANNGTEATKTVQLRFDVDKGMWASKTLSMKDFVKFEYAGYKFTNWTYARSAYGIVVEEGIPLLLNGDGDTFTIYADLGGTDEEGDYADYALCAEWAPNVWTVTFNNDDDTLIGSWTLPFGAEIVTPDSILEGWVIKGWDPLVPATMPNKDMTFKAIPKTAKFDVTFDADGATGSNPAISFQYAFDADLDKYDWNNAEVVVTNKITKEGYTLAWWEAEYTYALPTDGSIVTNTAIIECETVEPKDGEPFTICTIPWDLCTFNEGGVDYTAQKDVTLKPFWVKNMAAVYESGEDIIQPATTSTVYWTTLKDGKFHYDWVSKPVAAPFKAEGYTVVGWDYLRVDGYDKDHNPIVNPYTLGTKDDLIAGMFGWAEDSVTDPLDGVLFAQWEVNKWTVTFKDEDDSDYEFFADVPYGTKMVKPVNKAGQMPLGFSPELPETMPDSNCVFKITGWTNNTHYVTFDANGGEGKIDPVKFEYNKDAGNYGGPQTVKNSFSRDGYTFLGYNDLAGTFYPNEGKTQTIPADINGDKDAVLTAVWAKDFVITLDGGDVKTNLVYTYDQYTEAGFALIVTNDILEATGKTVVSWTYRPFWLKDEDPDYEILPNEYYINYPNDWWSENLVFIEAPDIFGSELIPETGMYRPLDGTLKAVWNDDVVATMVDNDFGARLNPVTLGWAEYWDGVTVMRWYQATEVEVPFTQEGYSVDQFEFEYYDIVADEYWDNTTGTFYDGDKLKVWLWADMFGLEDDLDGVNPPLDGDLIADWSVNSWKVYFKEYVSQKPADAKSYECEYGAPIPVPDSWIAGKKIVGWMNDDSEAVEIPATMPDTELVFTAVWADNSFTVTFDADGGALSTNSVSFAWDKVTADYGDAASIKDVATREGFTLAGWAYTYNKVNTDGTIVETNKTLAATTFEDGSSVSVIFPDFCTDGDGKNPVFKDATLKALWVTNVVVTLNGGEGYEPVEVELPWDTAADDYFPVTVSSPFEKEGNRLTAFTYTYFDKLTEKEETRVVYEYFVVTNGFKVDYIGDKPVTNYVGLLPNGLPCIEDKFEIFALYPNGELDLTPSVDAVWTPNTAKVSFYDVDGKTLLATWTQDFGKPVYEPDLANIGISNGCRVASWTPALPGSMPDHAMDFVASGWVPNKFKVYFDANGGVGEMDPVEFVYDAEKKSYGPDVDVTATFTREGYTLAGWDYVWSTLTKAEEGYSEGEASLPLPIVLGEVSYEFKVGPEINYNKDATLYAYWEKDAVFTFAANDGVTADAQVAVKYPFLKDVVVSNNVLAASGKSAVGWTYRNKKWEEDKEKGLPVPDYYVLNDGPDAKSLGNSAYLYWTIDPYVFGADDDGLPLDGTFNAVWADNMTFQLASDPEGITEIVPVELGWYDWKDGRTWYQTLDLESPFLKVGQSVETWENTDSSVVVNNNGDNTYTFAADMFGLEADGTPKTGTLGAYWTVATHLAKFYDDKTADPYVTLAVKYGEEIPVPDSIYLGKMVDVATIEPALDATMPDKDVEYVFKWTDSAFTVSFDANGGTGTMDPVAFAWDKETGTYGEYAAVPCTITRDGYTLAGWDYSFLKVNKDGSVVPVVGYLPNWTMDVAEDGTLVPVTEIYPTYYLDDWGNVWTDGVFYKDVTFKARWVKNVYFTVTDGNGYSKVVPVPITEDDIYIPDYYFANPGKTLKSLTYRPEDLADDKDDVECDIVFSAYNKDFTFNAWMFTAKIYDHDKVDPAEGTLKATWTDNAVFTVDPGTGSDAPVTVELGWAQYGKESKYYGVEWYQNSDFEFSNYKREGMTLDKFTYTKYRENKATDLFTSWWYIDGDGVEHKYITLTADMFGLNPKTKEPILEGTITGHWAKNTPTITFDYNGGVDNLGKTSVAGVYTWGDALVTPEATKVVRTGYTLLGWVNDETDEFFEFGTDMYVPGEDTTFVARWSNGTTYTVTFDGNGAEAGSMAPQEFFVGEKTAIAENGFVLTGFTLQGWALKKEDADNGKFDYAAGADFTVKEGDPETVTFYGVWKRNVVKVVFDYNGVVDGDGATKKDVTGPYGEKLAAPDIAALAPEGTFFGGWDPEFVDDMFPPEDTEYVAQWNPLSFTISYDANGGEGVMADQTIVWGEPATYAPNAFTREGYTFLGWALAKVDADAGKWDFADGAAVELKKSEKLYAAWSINTYKMTFNYAGGIDAEGNASYTTNLVFGAELSAPAVSRDGFIWLGWSPSVPATVPAGDTTFVAQWEKIISSGLWVTPVEEMYFDVKETIGLTLGDVFEVDSSVGTDEPTVTIAGLPGGVKYDTKNKVFTGAPTRDGVYYVTCTAKNKSKYTYVATSVWTVGAGTTGDDDGLEIGALIAGLEDLKTGFYYEIGGLTMIKSVAGLPTGLKFDAKKGVIAGTPTKAGKAVVKFTGVGTSKKTQKTVVVVDSGMYDVSIVVNPEDMDKGTVNGFGVYAVGKKVNLRANAKTGWAFAGWWLDDSFTIPASSDTSYLDANFPMILEDADNVKLYVKYVSVAEDLASITLDVNGTPFDPLVPENWTITAGVAVDWPVDQSADSATKVTAAGLPAGLKLVQDKVTKAYSVTGAPTTASKADAKTGILKASVVTFKVQSTRNKVEYKVNVTVNPLPSWIVGSFDGDITDGATVNGLVQSLTVAAGGKVSGKILKGDQTWTLSAPWLDSYVEDSSATATVIAKSGKVVVTNEIMFTNTTIGDTTAGVATGMFGDDYLLAYQNLWKTEPWKTNAKNFANKTVEVPVAGGSLTLKFAATGAVTVAGNFTVAGKAYKASGTSVLIPIDATDFFVDVYLPAKNSFGGFSDEISLYWNGSAFEVR